MKLIKRNLLPMVALLLVSSMLLLPSCGSTYQVTMDGWENGGEHSAPENPEGGEELSLPEKPSLPEELPPAQSLLPDETTKEPDPVTNALQELLNAKQYTEAEFVGFSSNLRYFVADFRGTDLEERYGLGCYLFMVSESITDKELQKVCDKLQEAKLFKELFLFFMTEEYKEIINENLAKIEQSADLQQMILSFLDTETAQKLCDFLEAEDGKALLSLYRYVEEPQEGFPLVRQGSFSPEPAEKYSTKWLEWLTTYDFGETYPMVYSGGLYNTIRWPELEQSAWELWPYNFDTDGITRSHSHFHLNIIMNASEFDGTPDIGTENYKYTWKVFYRELDSTEEYKSVTCAPWGAITFGESFLYHIDLYSAGMTDLKLKEDGSANTYHMIFMIFDEQGEQVIWRDEMVQWTNSSEAYLNKAIEKGVVPETA